MYKLYNFEAIFNQYINSKNIPNKTQKRYLVLFRSFLNWITLKLQTSPKENTTHSLLPFLKNETLLKYKSFLLETKRSRTSIQLRLALLSDFASFLKKKDNIILKNISNPSIIMEESIIDEFIEELEEKGASSTTLRSYKSDVRQFLTFLRNEST